MNADLVVRVCQQLGITEQLAMDWPVLIDRLTRFTRMVEMQERERCASLCDRMAEANEMEHRNERALGNWECAVRLREATVE